MRNGSSRLQLLACVLVAASFPARSAPAQAPVAEAPAGSIRGSVIDATSAAGLGGSTVTLIPRGGAGALPPRRSGVQFSNGVTVTTAGSGAYEFTGLAQGEYTVLVQRMGYEPARVDVQLPASGDARLSIGLVLQPVRLQAVRVEARRDTALSLADLGLADSTGRIAAALERQRLFLATDARELTAADMHESVALGSSDVLRALQRLPGVAHADERSAMLWVRGNRWDHTRVFFDDVPLFQPLSALGALSGVNAAAIGSAFLLPGVRPVSLGGDGAARVDLRTGLGVADGKLRGSADLSVMGGGGALGYRRADDRAGVQLTARQGLNDVFRSEGIPSVFGYLSTSFRYDELTTRADARLGPGRLESSALYSRDELVTRSKFQPVRQTWDTRAARVTYARPLGRLHVSTTVSGTRFDADRTHVVWTRWDATGFDSEGIPSVNSAHYLSVGTRLTAPLDSLGRGWSAGMDAISLRNAFAGPRASLVFGDTAIADTSGRGSTAYLSGWAERRWRPTPRVMLETGFRLDAGGQGLPSVRPAGSLQARIAVTSATALSMAGSRTHSYMQQAQHRPSGAYGSGEAVARPWITAGADAPMLTVDQVGAGAEHWLAKGYLMAGNVYARSSAGVLSRDPRPGSLIGRPFVVTGRESAIGAELSARKLAGRLTGMLAYSYQHARAEAAGWRYESDANRPHALDATLTAHLGRWRVGAGYGLTSGAPVTMLSQTQAACDSTGACRIVWDAIAGTPGKRRVLTLSTLDLLADWTRPVGATQLTFFFGGRVDFPAGQQNAQVFVCSTPVQECWENIPFRRSWHVAPALGLRLSF